jgi:hypothetical protein
MNEQKEAAGEFSLRLLLTYHNNLPLIFPNAVCGPGLFPGQHIVLLRYRFITILI